MLSNNINKSIKFERNGNMFIVEWDTYFQKNAVIIDRVLVGDIYLYLCEADIFIRGREIDWSYGYTIEYDVSTIQLWSYGGLKEYEIGKKIYTPKDIDPEMNIWDNSQEEIQSIISENNKKIEKFIEQNGDLLQNHVDEYKEDIDLIIEEEKLEKERIEKEKSEKNNESISDYNSRQGSSSTWFGDAGWMDE